MAPNRPQPPSTAFEDISAPLITLACPCLQSSAEKLRQHLVGRSRGRAHGRAAGAASVHASTSASVAAEQLQILDKELQTHGKSPKAMITVSRAKQVTLPP